MAPDLFPRAHKQKAPERPRKTPEVPPVRYAGGVCTAACMFALGPDCDCACLGRNHQAGLRCELVEQQTITL